MQLRGKVAVVTGAGGGGIGRALARRLAHDGSAVVVADVDEQGGHTTARRIEAEGGRAAFFRADVGIEGDVRALVAFAERTFGGLDILVNNAGPYHAQDPLAYWAEMIQANLLGVAYGTLQGIQAMRRRGGGAIVNLASTSALGFGPAPSAAYDAAKAGVMRLTAALAWLQSEKIRVNCLAPDWVATEELVAYVTGLSLEERRRANVPNVLTPVEDIVSGIIRLITDDSLAGRVLIWWSGQPPRLIPFGDRGYGALE